MKNFNSKIFLLPIVFFSLAGCGSLDESHSVKSTTGSTFTFKKNDINCGTTTKDPDWFDWLQERNNDEFIVCSGSGIKKDISGNRFVMEFRNKYCVAYGLGQKWFPSNSVICSAAEHFEIF